MTASATSCSLENILDEVLSKLVSVVGSGHSVLEGEANGVSETLSEGLAGGGVVEDLERVVEVALAWLAVVQEESNAHSREQIEQPSQGVRSRRELLSEGGGGAVGEDVSGGDGSLTGDVKRLGPLVEREVLERVEETLHLDSEEIGLGGALRFEVGLILLEAESEAFDELLVVADSTVIELEGVRNGGRCGGHSQCASEFHLLRLLLIQCPSLLS